MSKERVEYDKIFLLVSPISKINLTPVGENVSENIIYKFCEIQYVYDFLHIKIAP